MTSSFASLTQRELVHPAAVDLHLLLVEAVHEVDGRDVGGDVLLDRERGVREGRGKGRSGNLRQGGERGTAAVHLRGGDGRVREPVGARELAIQIVEAAVLEVDDDDVTEPA